jgi:hypothetical protein
MEQIVAELKGLVVRMRQIVEPHKQASASEAETHGEIMVDALSAAIARLRANVADVEAVGEPREPAFARAPAPPGAAHTVPEPPDATHVVPAPPGAARTAPDAPAVARKPHKHSMSLLGRWRMRRKQRRSR